MKKLLFLFTLLIFITHVFGQNFFDTDFNRETKYVILCNPTTYRIKTIEYLTENNLLKINQKKIQFVGVYYEEEKQDYSQTQKYIEEKELTNFFLHEIKGELNVNNLYQKNNISSQLKKVFNNSIGIFFFGGDDIPPELYGEENTYSAVYTPARHYFETTFLFHLLGGYQNKNFKPFLEECPNYMVSGFCLGMQTMNVATGGTMIQDIPAEIYGVKNAKQTVKIEKQNIHRNYWQKINDGKSFMSGNFHEIIFTDSPFFRKKIRANKKLRPLVYSVHHQAVEKLGKNMEITCLSSDGKVIEGLTHKKYKNVFGVQFHPEVSAIYENMEPKRFRPDDTPMTYHSIIGRTSVSFHKKYWKHISRVLRKNN